MDNNNEKEETEAPKETNLLTVESGSKALSIADKPSNLKSTVMDFLSSKREAKKIFEKVII